MTFQAILDPGCVGHGFLDPGCFDRSYLACECPGLGCLCVQPKMRNTSLNNKIAFEEKVLLREQQIETTLMGARNIITSVQNHLITPTCNYNWMLHIPRKRVIREIL